MSASWRTPTAYFRARPVLVLAIVCILASIAVAQGPKHAETTPPSATLADAKSLLQKGLVRQAEKATRQFLYQHADSAEGHYLLGHVLFEEIRQKYAGEEQKQGENFRYSDTVDTSLIA